MSLMRFLLKSLLVVALAWPAFASAALTQAQINKLQLDVWRVRADFHMYSVMAGDAEYRRTLNRSIETAVRSFRELSADAESDTERALVSALQPLWQEFERAARDNRIAEQGYTDTYAVQDVNQYSAQIAMRLYEYEGASEARGDDLMAMATYMQRMASEYLFLAAAPEGGQAMGTDVGRVEFRVTVPEFDQMVASALRNYGAEGGTGRALQDVEAKWRFIRESLVKFYENAVPFLVHRYTDQMVNQLQAAAERERGE